MNSKLRTPTPLTHKLDPNLKFVTITHPGHKFYGHKVEIARAHRTKPLIIVVKLPTGDKVAISAEWTDYKLDSSADTALATHLLDIKGLLDIVAIIGQGKRQGKKTS
jgi:hypothetical protein